MVAVHSQGLSLAILGYSLYCWLYDLVDYLVVDQPDIQSMEGVQVSPHFLHTVALGINTRAVTGVTITGLFLVDQGTEGEFLQVDLQNLSGQRERLKFYIVKDPRTGASHGQG